MVEFDRLDIEQPSPAWLVAKHFLKRPPSVLLLEEEVDRLRVS
jgi:hypothetical protein